MENQKNNNKPAQSKEVKWPDWLKSKGLTQQLVDNSEQEDAIFAQYWKESGVPPAVAEMMIKYGKEQRKEQKNKSFKSNKLLAGRDWWKYNLGLSMFVAGIAIFTLPDYNFWPSFLGGALFITGLEVMFQTYKGVTKKEIREEFDSKIKELRREIEDK